MTGHRLCLLSELRDVDVLKEMKTVLFDTATTSFPPTLKHPSNQNREKSVTLKEHCELCETGSTGPSFSLVPSRRFDIFYTSFYFFLCIYIYKYIYKKSQLCVQEFTVET